jgi:hypothetical protein
MLQNKILFCKLLCRFVTSDLLCECKGNQIEECNQVGFGNFSDMLVYLCMDSNFSFSPLHSVLQKKTTAIRSLRVILIDLIKQSSWMYICFINKHLISVSSTCLYI